MTEKNIEFGLKMMEIVIKAHKINCSPVDLKLELADLKLNEVYDFKNSLTEMRGNRSFKEHANAQ